MALGMHRIAAGQQYLLVIVKYLPENRIISEKRGTRVLQLIVDRFRNIYILLLVLLGQMIPGMAQAGTYDGAMRSTDYRVFSADVNGDGREDILIRAYPKLVMLPFDDDLIIPIKIKPRSPSFMLLSSANGSYELVADPDAAQLAFAGWTAANYSLVFGDAQGADAGSASRGQVCHSDTASTLAQEQSGKLLRSTSSRVCGWQGPRLGSEVGYRAYCVGTACRRDSPSE